MYTSIHLYYSYYNLDFKINTKYKQLQFLIIKGRKCYTYNIASS